jgi:hypothetical protein
MTEEATKNISAVLPIKDNEYLPMYEITHVSIRDLQMRYQDELKSIRRCRLTCRDTLAYLERLR